MEGVLIAARTLHFAAAVSLTGIFAFRCLVAGPAFRGSGIGRDEAERLRPRLSWLGWASLVLLVASGMAWLVLVAARMSGRPVGAALSQGVLAIVLWHTRLGEDWLLRSALAALLALCLFAAARPRLRASAAVAWAGFLLGGLMLVALAWAGHGGATAGGRGEVHLAADVLHLLAAGVWLGALVPLAALLGEARRGDDPRWRLLARIAISRFSAMAVAAVGILIASGFVNTWFLAGTVPALVGTGYGRLLLLKVALFFLMLVIAALNMRRLSPRLTERAATAIGHLRRNALVEAAIGLAVLAVVGALGVLPPGLHTEPRWPFPVRADLGELPLESAIALAVLAALSGGCAVAAVAAAAAGHYRRAARAAAGFVVCLAAAWIPLRPAIEPAYPTSFYAPTEPYAADSVARGASLYAANCTPCHGASGRGDGPLAAGLPIRPADLTEPHLFAHKPGDLFWWIGHGRRGGVMPGFANVLKPSQRWDVINFILARAAGVQSRQIGPELTAEATSPVPDFAFEVGGAQTTLRQMLKKGPLLLVLYGPPAPVARLRELVAAQPLLAAAGLQIVAIGLGAGTEGGEGASPLAAQVSRDVGAALALFRGAGDGESELMLDRGGNVRLHWRGNSAGGLASPERLAAAAERVARIPVAAASHAGHAH